MKRRVVKRQADASVTESDQQGLAGSRTQPIEWTKSQTARFRLWDDFTRAGTGILPTGKSFSGAVQAMIDLLKPKGVGVDKAFMNRKEP
ncbi:MAG TPA: hypothetical protein VF173_36340 [Thermoanaerobaculia bacterium]|nr:hypothetical protein [Thermoanaerobaculia bacterium]